MSIEKQNKGVNMNFDEYINELSNSLERKYLQYAKNTTFLDLWADWWQDDCPEAIDMFEEFAISDNEIQAWLYKNGVKTYEEELKEDYGAVLV